MKICLITKECFPFSYGGIGSAFYFLGKSLTGFGHEVVLLSKRSANYDNSTYSQYYSENFRIEWIDFQEGVFSPHAVLDYSFQLAAHFEKFNQSFQADIALYPEFDGDAFFLVREKNAGGKHRNTAFAVHYSGPLSSLYEAEQLSAGLYEEIIFEMEDYCIRGSSFSIAPSVFIRDILKNKHGLDWQQNALLSNPVNPLFQLPPAVIPEIPADRKNIVFVGRLQKVKGADHVINAFASLIARGTEEDIRLQLIGRDIYWDEYGMTFSEYWKSRLDERTLSGIDFIGPLPQSQIQDHLKKAWVAVFPSRFEVFGNVALEALFSGTPILVNARTGLSEVIGPDYGFSWDGEPHTLAAGLYTLLHDPLLRNELAVRSAERARNLHREFLDAIPGILEKILSHNGFNISLPVTPEGKLFDLVNRYCTELIGKKDNEIIATYTLKDVELKKAWTAFDKKNEELSDLWTKLDEKNVELTDLWKQLDKKNEELTGLWKNNNEENQLSSDKSKMLDEKNAELNQIKAQLIRMGEDILAGKQQPIIPPKPEGAKWGPKFFRNFFRSR